MQTLSQLIAVNSPEDILPEYRQTPIEQLLMYHNAHLPFADHTEAKLLVGMCMDNRKRLHIPQNFAFVLRTGGGNLRYSEFKISYAVALGGVSAIALISHTNCGMLNIFSRKEEFINGLVNSAGWSQFAAEEHFHHFAPLFAIENEVDFVSNEAKRLREKYPKILIAPLVYRVEDNLLYQVND